MPMLSITPAKVAFTCLTFALSGCAVSTGQFLPKVAAEDQYLVADMLFSLECEMNEAIERVDQLSAALPKKNRISLRNLNAKATLDLTVTEVRNAKGGVVFAIPVGGGKFSLGGSTSLNNSAKRFMQFKVNYDTSDLNPCSQKRMDETGRKRIASGLGLTEWVESLFNSLTTNNETPVYASYSVTFTVEKTDEANAGFTRATSSSGTLTANGSNKRTVMHLLSITVDTVPDFSHKKGPVAARKSQNLSDAADNFLLRTVLERNPG